MRFIARGSLTLNGVVFIIEADTINDAKQKAAAGLWTDYETFGAESVDWDIRPKTVEADE